MVDLLRKFYAMEFHAQFQLTLKVKVQATSGEILGIHMLRKPLKIRSGEHCEGHCPSSLGASHGFATAIDSHSTLS